MYSYTCTSLHMDIMMRIPDKEGNENIVSNSKKGKFFVVLLVFIYLLIHFGTRVVVTDCGEKHFTFAVLQLPL